MGKLEDTLFKLGRIGTPSAFKQALKLIATNKPKKD